MQQIKNELSEANRSRNDIDKFLTRFLEQFEMKMDYEELNSPYWNLYRDKTKQRAELTEKIKSLEYRVKRG
jgi:hypothetical protein